MPLISSIWGDCLTINFFIFRDLQKEFTMAHPLLIIEAGFH